MTLEQLSVSVMATWEPMHNHVVVRTPSALVRLQVFVCVQSHYKKRPGEGSDSYLSDR